MPRLLFFARHILSLWIIIVVFGAAVSGCGYRIVKSTPYLRHGISHLTLERVENRSGIIGVEGPIRRNLEAKLLDYVGSLDDHPKGCEDFGRPIVFHGMNQTLEFVDSREAEENKAACLRKPFRSQLVVRILDITLKPTAFIVGKGTGQSFDLKKDALLASTYQVDTKVELEIYDPYKPLTETEISDEIAQDYGSQTVYPPVIPALPLSSPRRRGSTPTSQSVWIPGQARDDKVAHRYDKNSDKYLLKRPRMDYQQDHEGYKKVIGPKRHSIHKSTYTYTSSFNASVNQSDLTGASKNYIRNQLLLMEALEPISKAIADNVFNDLTSIF